VVEAQGDEEGAALPVLGCLRFFGIVVEQPHCGEAHEAAQPNEDGEDDEEPQQRQHRHALSFGSPIAVGTLSSRQAVEVGIAEAGGGAMRAGAGLDRVTTKDQRSALDLFERGR